MERLWAGDLSQLPAAQQLHALNLSAAGQPPWAARNGTAPANGANGANGAGHANGAEGAPKTAAMALQPDEDDQPMICMICEDKATGLHYGIITCEG